MVRICARPLGRADLVADPTLAEALFVASPDLSNALARDSADRRARRAMAAYVSRSTYRATPFGLFAGVALGSFADRSAGGVAGRRLLVRPDDRWLDALLADLRRRVGELDGVGLLANPLVRRRGDRLVAPGDLVVDNAPIVDLLRAQCRQPRSVGDVLDAVLGVAPALTSETVRALIGALVAGGVLLSTLDPPPGSADPLGHLAVQLDTDRPAWSRPLRDLADEMARAARRPPGTAVPALRAAQARLAAVHPAPAALHVDLAFDGQLQLPRAVATELERAVAVALRCSPAPGPAALTAYHRRFVERYGCGCSVPVLDVIDPVSGIGPLPRVDRATPPDDERRDRTLLRIAVEAGAGGDTEIVLIPDLIAELTRPDGPDPGPSLEVHAHLVARCAAAIDRGEFRLVVSRQGGAALAGASTGRFAALLGRASRAAAWTGPVAGYGGGRAVLAEVVHRAPLVAHPGWAPLRIPVGVVLDGAGIVTPDELAVWATPEHLVVWSPQLGCEIVGVTYSTTDPADAPSLARTILGLGRQGTSDWRLWDWGAAANLPFRPRVRTGRTVLSPAAWTIPERLRRAAKGASTWSAELAAWREHDAVPTRIVAGATDECLTLDLARPTHVDILRREVVRHGSALTITETPGTDADLGWVIGPDGRHAADVVFSLRSDRPITEARSSPRHGTTRLSRPGGDVLAVELGCLSPWQDDVLVRCRTDLLPGTDALSRQWYFLRYAEEPMGPHLRLRWRGDVRSLLPVVHDWVTGLGDDGLVSSMRIVDYYPETARFGGPVAMPAAEAVWVADARAAVEIIAGTRDGPRADARADARLQRAAEGVIRIVRGLCRPGVGRAPWPGVRLTQAQRATVTRLRAPVRAAARHLDERPELQAYRAVLADDRTDDIARTLAHLHCNRLGVDETIAFTLAADAIRAASAVEPTSKPDPGDLQLARRTLIP